MKLLHTFKSPVYHTTYTTIDLHEILRVLVSSLKGRCILLRAPDRQTRGALRFRGSPERKSETGGHARTFISLDSYIALQYFAASLLFRIRVLIRVKLSLPTSTPFVQVLLVKQLLRSSSESPVQSFRNFSSVFGRYTEMFHDVFSYMVCSFQGQPTVSVRLVDHRRPG